MTISDKKEILKKLWPNAPGSLIDAVIQHGPEIGAQYEINTPLRLAHFFAQISHESDGGSIPNLVENMNYSAKRMTQVWPSRFPTVASAEPYAHNPKALANKVYNGRMGNRVGTDDGYNYRGHGLLQLTGREAYISADKELQLGIADDPDKASKGENALEIAAWEFKRLKCLPSADADDVKTVTKKVNGGYIGLDDRKAWLAKWKKVLVPKLDLVS